MALRITKAAEPIQVERLNVCIYAPPGLGKTSMAFTADTPLLLDFDRGAYRAGNRKDIVPITTWTDVEMITPDDLVPYKTVVMDTAGRALDCLAVDIIKKNPKAGRGGALTLQGYGELKSRFAGFLRFLNSFQKDVILVCHMSEERNGDDVIERLDAQGSSKGEIYKSVDAMGRIFVRNGKRYLDFSPREGSFGKNPGQMGEIEIPHPDKAPKFLAETITAIKAKLNEMNVDQTASQRVVDDWIAAIADFQTVDEFNQALEQIRKAPQAAQALYNRAAKAKHFTFNKTAGRYEAEAAHAAA